MANEGAAPEFARDLGYLDRFLDGLEAHAATLDAGSGARLRTLLGEERARWREIRGLVGAGPATAAPAEAPPPDADPGARAPPGLRAFTVGSLRRREEPASP